MARYGEQKFPFTEDMKTLPQDPYGIAKVAAEETLVNLCNTHKLIGPYLFRTILLDQDKNMMILSEMSYQFS